MLSGSHKHKPRSMPRLLLGVLVLVLLSVGIAASYALLGSSQDLRQQASGPSTCAEIGQDQARCELWGCTYSLQQFRCTDHSVENCPVAQGCSVHRDCGGTITARCEDFSHSPSACRSLGCTFDDRDGRTCSGTIVQCTSSQSQTQGACQAKAWAGCRWLEQCLGTGSTQACTGTPLSECGNGLYCNPSNQPVGSHRCVTISGSQSLQNNCCSPGQVIHEGRCVERVSAIRCQCQFGEQQGVSGPANCEGPGTPPYIFAERPGCKPNPNGGSGGSTGTNSSPYPIGGGTGGTGGGNGGTGGGSTGGTGGGGGSNPWGARSISGKVVCSINNQPVANVPVTAYVGTNSGPGNVIKSGKTAGNGQYNLSLDGQNERFTVRVMAGANSKDHDYAFKRSGNPGITCIDNNAFELCRYLEIPVGTTKTGFDYTTAAQATNLRGSQQVGNLFVFQFNQARDVRGGYLKQYVVRLDNKADGWYNANSDYYVRVPKEGTTGVGTCSGGVCRITSSELNAIRPFKLGTYSMGVNPISNHQVSGQPIIELCRADATVIAAFTNAPPTAPTSVQPCGNGWGTCRAATQGAVVGATTCYTGAQSTNNYNEWNCCPAGNVILNGRCAKVGGVNLR